MSNYLETDFCETEEGLDYIFGYMSAVYGASFTRHWEQVDPSLVRSVWQKELGKFLTYKPSLEYALGHLPANMPPSAIAFKKTCNDGPAIPVKPVLRIEKQMTQYERARAEMVKSEALAKLAELKRDMKAGIISRRGEDDL
jgi:hypothetical protein